MVEVLYCSGDLHVGDVVGAVPQRGYQNTQAALDWVARRVGTGVAGGLRCSSEPEGNKTSSRRWF